MSFFSNNSATTTNNYAASSSLDFNAVMRRVYMWMSIGLLVAFGVAYLVGTPAANAYQAAINGTATTTYTSLEQISILFNPVVTVISLIAYVVLAFALNPIIRRASPTVGAIFYLLFTALFGFMISSIFLAYSQGTIAAALIATTVAFGAVSIYGYTTKADLSRLGTYLFMALIGLLAATLVNLIFFRGQNQLLYWLVNYAGVLIFTGLTAYDTQWIKNNAMRVAGTGDSAAVERVALYGAFHLFMDFVNLFLYILRILGSGNRR